MVEFRVDVLVEFLVAALVEFLVHDQQPTPQAIVPGNGHRPTTTIDLA